MALNSRTLVVITPELVMQGELKVGADLRFETSFSGKVQSQGSVIIPPGVRIEADLKSNSLKIEQGGYLKGKLQVGEANKFIGQIRSWVNRMGRSRE